MNLIVTVGDGGAPQAAEAANIAAAAIDGHRRAAPLLNFSPFISIIPCSAIAVRRLARVGIQSRLATQADANDRP
ncbi:hypothetical protein [Burkholderia pseudomallei]|uniref:hypothetical protein n=1 Tax=Burkholderia pseudomallei TaxID=28450 RepID=UPI002FC32BB3